MKLFVISIIFMVVGILSLSSQETDVTIYYYERMPFFGQINTADEGVILEIVQEIFDKAEVPYHFEKMPVTRIFEMLKKNNTNACFPGVFRNQAREKIYTFSEFPIYQDTSPHYVIRKSDEMYFAHIDAIQELLLTDKKVGMIERYSYGRWVDDNIKRFQPTRVIVNIGDDQKNFYKMLLAKRFDYFFASIEEAKYIIRSDESFTSSIVVKNLVDAPEGNIRWIIFNKGFQPELISRINNSILIVTKSDWYKTIVNQLKSN